MDGSAELAVALSLLAGFLAGAPLLALVLLAAWVYAQMILDRCRMAAWDADWAVIELQWTR